MNHIIMIKKILYRFLPVCLLVAGFSGCKDDTMEPLPETVPLIVEANAKSFVMGEKLILTVKVNDTKNPDRVSNEDFDIYLTAKGFWCHGSIWPSGSNCIFPDDGICGTDFLRICHGDTGCKLHGTLS